MLKFIIHFEANSPCLSEHGIQLLAHPYQTVFVWSYNSLKNVLTVWTHQMIDYIMSHGHLLACLNVTFCNAKTKQIWHCGNQIVVLLIKIDFQQLKRLWQSCDKVAWF